MRGPTRGTRRPAFLQPLPLCTKGEEYSSSRRRVGIRCLFDANQGAGRRLNSKPLKQPQSQWGTSCRHESLTSRSASRRLQNVSDLLLRYNAAVHIVQAQVFRWIGLQIYIICSTYILFVVAMIVKDVTQSSILTRKISKNESQLKTLFIFLLVFF